MHELVEAVCLFRTFRHPYVLHQRLQQQVQRKENVFIVVDDEHFSFFLFFHIFGLFLLSARYFFTNLAVR